MGLHVGTTDVTDVYLGTTPVTGIYVGTEQVWPADPGPGGTPPTLVGGAVGGGWIGSPTATWNIPTIAGLSSTDRVLVVAIEGPSCTWSGTGWTTLDTVTSGGWAFTLLEGTGASPWTIDASTSPGSCDILAVAWSGADGIEIGAHNPFYTGGDPGMFEIDGFTASGPASAILVSFLEWSAGVTTTDPVTTRFPPGANQSAALHDRGTFSDGVIGPIEADYFDAWSNALGIQVAAYAL